MLDLIYEKKKMQGFNDFMFYRKEATYCRLSWSKGMMILNEARTEFYQKIFAVVLNLSQSLVLPYF